MHRNRKGKSGDGIGHELGMTCFHGRLEKVEAEQEELRKWKSKLRKLFESGAQRLLTFRTSRRDWDIHAQWSATSPELRLIFDDICALPEEATPSLRLPLFKSAVISYSTGTSQGRRPPYNDIVLHIGGPIWALDWCPQRPGWGNNGAEKREFLAVGAHPRSAPYNRLGKPLSGKGLIQIWVLDLMNYDSEEDEDFSTGLKGSGGSTERECKSIGRPRGSDRGRGRGRGVAQGRGRGKTLEDSDGTIIGLQDNGVGLKDSDYLMATSSGPASCPLPKNRSVDRPRKLRDIARAKGMHFDTAEPLPLPRLEESAVPAQMILGLAHDGLVTWDAKWQPVGEVKDFTSGRELLRLGFLAVVLGDGSIQVFDVPLPSILSENRKESLSSEAASIVQIEPVFKCSNLQRGGHKSLPTSLEWSTWPPHDLLLVGFHDASVGVWKFTSSSSPTETRPLTFFTADTLPLRTVAWAPDGSGSSGKHLIVTAGHSGWVKFWDLRDFFRPLWDLQISRSCIFSLDWLPFPRCILICMDDGTIRLLGLENASSSTPATGEPWRGTHSQGLQCYLCSSFAIWGIHASRVTGLVAYAGSNGSVLQFQLTEKAIFKEGARSREPHFLCGAFVADTEDGPLTILSPKRNSPAQMKKSATQWSSTPTSKRNFLASCTLDEIKQSVEATRDGSQLTSNVDLPPVPKSKRSKGSTAVGTIRSIRKRDQSRSNDKNNFDSESLLISDTSMALVMHDQPGLNGEWNREQPQNGSNSSAPSVESFPCRNVAVHRLRWNCNEDRRQWLAYGGAAGIVRCQQVYSMKKKKKQ